MLEFQLFQNAPTVIASLENQTTERAKAFVGNVHSIGLSAYRWRRIVLRTNACQGLHQCRSS